VRENPGGQHYGVLITTARRFAPPWTAAPRGEHSSIPAKTGVGLRFPHDHIIVETKPYIAQLEVYAENYMGGRTPLSTFDAIRHNYPISLHGVAPSLRSAAGFDTAHPKRIRDVVGGSASAQMASVVISYVVIGIHSENLLRAGFTPALPASATPTEIAM